MSTFNTKAEEFLAQDRIAVAGVSRTKKDAANIIYCKLRESGRQVFAVNPNTDTAEGDTCYASLQAIPGGVDGVVIVTRPELTEQVVRDTVEAGVPRVWMHNNTFAPSSVSDTAVQICKDNNITVIDGGCPMMFLDFGHKCMRWMLGIMKRLPE
ncbi:MAG: CoA-binding protein [Chloroflexi bacterium]|jgi:predicted CoA-binding protein|nr:CoA-binding protein [Chloroflexota bacterium]